MKNKIILINPKVDPNIYRKGVPLGLLSIISLLENKYDIKIINVDVFVNDSYKKKIVELTKDALCFGISSMTGYQLKESLIFAKLIKKNYPNIPIVWGGYHASILPEQTILNENVDIIVKGQGQRTFYELIKNLEKGTSLENVKGILYKENGKIIDTGPRPFEDINNFPPLPYHLFKETKEYVNSQEKRNIHYFSSQGCPYRCSFCADQLVNKRKWSGLNAEQVVDDFERLIKDYNVNYITLNDNNFFVDEERVRKICKEIIKRKLNIRWGNANGRAPQLINFDKKLWELLEKSGCDEILFGAESGSQETLDFLKKDMKVEDTLKLAKLLKKYNINTSFPFMVGFPPKTINGKKEVWNDLEANMELINEILKIRNDNNIVLYTYTPYPGSPLYDLSLKRGLKEPRCLGEWANFEFVKNKSPWVPKNLFKLTRYLQDFIFPYMSELYAERHIKKFSTLQNTFHTIAKKRWKNKFFKFPLEYKLFNFYKFLRNIKRKKEERIK